MLPDSAIFEVLARHNVQFVIVGGHAVNFHGFTRLTEDTDVVWLRSTDAEIALERALTEMHARYIAKDIDPATGIERTYPVSMSFIQSHQLMMLVTRYGFLDLFSYVPGHSEIDAKDLFDTSIESNGLRYASIEWLRRMKQVSGRTKDLIDLEKLSPE